MKSNTYFNAIWWMILALLLLATPGIGTLAGIGVSILAIFTLPILFNKTAIYTALKQPMAVMFLLAILIFAAVTAITAQTPADMQFVGNFLPFILSIPVYLLARKHAGRKTAIILLSLCLLGSILSLGVAIFDSQNRLNYRAQGFFSGAIVFARNAATLGFLAALGFNLISGPRRFLFLLGPIFSLITIFLAQSRGTIIALPILGLMLTYYILRHANSKKTKTLVLLGLAVLSALVLGFFLTGGGARIATLFSIIPEVLKTGNSGIRSIDIRLQFYSTGWELFQNAPLVGYGWAHMSDTVYTILDASKFETILVEQFHFHNDFFNFAVSGGVFGIVAWLLFLAAPIIGALKSTRDNLYRLRFELILLLFTLYFISGLTDMVIGFDLPSTMYAMLSAIIIGSVRETPSR